MTITLSKNPFEYIARVWLIRMPDTTTRFYDWSIWEKCFPCLDDIISLADAKAAIRSSQCIMVGGKLRGGSLSFGRMTWNYENNKKWACKYMKDEELKDNVVFLSTEIWAPSWSQCDRDLKPPSIVFHVKNPLGNFKDIFKIAIDRRIYDRFSIEIDNAISGITKIISTNDYKVYDVRWDGRPLIPGDGRSYSPIDAFPSQLWRNLEAVTKLKQLN
ncbi:hypothetical protein [Spongiibacter sp.]|uniref:hypothetical protein n=1 Tax=Spongiibacter sp. TaxID=2024860 RepID=UPI003564823B